MNWFKSNKVRKDDTLFSQYIRKRDKMLCQYNFRCIKGTEGSQNSHFQKRRHESVRMDEENCDWVCAKCHFFVENVLNGQKVLEAWKLKQLGEKRYLNLLVRTQSYKKKDVEMNVIIIKQLMKDFPQMNIFEGSPVSILD